MINELLAKYQEALSDFFNEVNIKEVEETFKFFKNCSGILFFSGIGKSSLIAEKIAVTMTSTGSRAVFISPIEAMHGDVGLITKNDIFVPISKSGETDELLNLLPYIRNKGAKIISFSSNPKGRLAKASDYCLKVPFFCELCPFNMAPTISTTTQVILGDVLAIALMQEKKFTLDQYAMNHPAGTIGKRITLRVQDLMLSNDLIPTCRPDDLLINTLVELSNKKAGCVLIINDNMQLLGIFTDGDLRRALQKFGAGVLHKNMEALMTKTAKFINPEALAWEAMKIMENNQKSPITVLPVLNNDGQVLGILKMHDIIQSGI